MAATFTPEEVKVYGPNGLQFSDAWGLTCVQLGTTVSKLLEVRSYARLTPTDLVGYHYIQYGIDEDIIEETIAGVQDGMWSDWDKATALKQSLPKVLGETTTGALTQRIRLGDKRQVEKIQLDPLLDPFFNIIEETDHTNHEVKSLYPKNNSELVYRGRVSLDIGSVVVGNVIGNLKTFADILDLSVEGGFQDRTVTASSINHGTSTSLRAIHVM